MFKLLTFPSDQIMVSLHKKHAGFQEFYSLNVQKKIILFGDFNSQQPIVLESLEMSNKDDKGSPSFLGSL
jgi:hypothetical protein